MEEKLKLKQIFEQELHPGEMIYWVGVSKKGNGERKTGILLLILFCVLLIAVMVCWGLLNGKLLTAGIICALAFILMIYGIVSLFSGKKYEDKFAITNERIMIDCYRAKRIHVGGKLSNAAKWIHEMKSIDYSMLKPRGFSVSEPETEEEIDKLPEYYSVSLKNGELIFKDIDGAKAFSVKADDAGEAYELIQKFCAEQSEF